MRRSRVQQPGGWASARPPGFLMSGLARLAGHLRLLEEHLDLLERAIPVITDGRFDAATAIAHLLKVEEERDDDA